MENRIIELLQPHLQHWGYYLILLMTFLETSVFLGLLVPGESVVVIAGLLASRGLLDLKGVIAAASLGAVLGDSVGYLIGDRLGERFLLKYGKYFLIKKDAQEEAKQFFQRHGGKVVFLGRFMAWLRAFAPALAGISKMSYPWFLLFNLSGGIAWAATFSLIGYFVGSSWEVIRRYFGLLGLLIFILGVMAFYFYSLLTKEKRLLQEKIRLIDRAFSSQMPRTSDFIKGRFRTGPWYGLNLTIGLVSLLLAILSFGEIVDALTDQETLFYLDFRIQRIVERITTPSLTRWMVDITNYGGIYLTAGVALFLFIFLLKRRNGWDLLSLFLAAGVGGVILGLMKLLFHRSRPIPQEINTKGFGFPSGHAFMAITVYGFLVYITWKEAKNTAIRLTVTAFAFLVILLVGFSRIYLNVHWLTDVLGGYAAGATMLIIAILIINTLKSAI